MGQIKNMIGFTLANLVIFYFTSRFFSDYLVFGTALTNPVSAIVLTALLLALVSASVDPVATHYKIKFSSSRWMIIYFVINSVTIYILARTPISLITAVGISAFWVALILGFIVNLAHFGVWKLLSKK